jgi:hypothetical protein
VAAFNRTSTANHVHDQAVFYGGGRYLYFDDGVLTSIQRETTKRTDGIPSIPPGRHQPEPPLISAARCRKNSDDGQYGTAAGENAGCALMKAS